MPSSRSSPSDGYSTGRRHTPTSPNIWRKGHKYHVFGGDSLFFKAGTFIPHASLSLQTGGGACEQPAAPFARPGVYTSASYRGVTGSEGQEGANGAGGGVGLGGGNGDSNGVGGGNGDVNGQGRGYEDRAGTGTGTGTGVEVNEGAQDGNGDGGGDP